MAGSAISTTVTNTVQLGGSLYPSPLTITSSGNVTPAAYGATGVIATVADASLIDMGRITGGPGDFDGSSGGIGVDLRSGGDRLSNAGTIAGGNGYTNNFSDQGSGPGAGGTAVAIASGRIANTGLITGGRGGYMGNTFAGTSGPGGTGVYLTTGSTLANSGTISGGGSYYAYDGDAGRGGDGVDVASGSMVHNAGTIAGAAGGTGGYRGGAGGIGVSVLSGGAVFNTGSIDGGAGGPGYGEESDLGSAGSGGAGVNLASGELVNRGRIEGGHGGFLSPNYAAGGNGVDVGSGAILINRGAISGGSADRKDNTTNATNGAGVVIDGGTLTDFGTITGGAFGMVLPGGAPAGDAVQFGTLAGTLIIHSSAVFNGLVVADTAADDTLRLAGNGGTLTGLGTEYAGFTTIVENPGATWTLDGPSTLDAGASLRDEGTLTVLGPLSGGGGVLIGSHADLHILSALDAATAHFAAGADATLSVAAGATVAATLSDFGNGDTIDIGEVANTLTYLGGTLTLENGDTSVATLTLAGHYTAANFHLESDEHGGTDISFVPASVTALPGRTIAATDASEAQSILSTFHTQAPDLFAPIHAHPA
jgi:hypothetical protein